MKKRKRHCGECTECCTHLRCGTFHKPAGISCQYLQVLPARGCSIHQDRPQECRDFKCAWLEGLIPLALRPDLSGIIARRFQINLPDGDQLTMLTVVHGEPTESQIELLVRSLRGNAVLVGNDFELGSENSLACYRRWQHEIAKHDILRAVD